MKTFYKWIVAQGGRDEPIGDLGNDVKRDPKCEQISNDFESWKDYLSRYSNEVNETLVEAWKEYLGESPAPKIKQITATSCWDVIERVLDETIYGLGEDNKMYRWDVDQDKWQPHCF